MITYLKEPYTKGGSSLVLLHNIIDVPSEITIVHRDALAGTKIKDPYKVVTFTVTTNTSGTLTGLTVINGDDQDLPIGSVVSSTAFTGTIKDKLSNKPVYTSDRFNNPEFIQSLAASKITDLESGSLPGTNALAIGDDAFATGLNTLAAGAQSFASGNGSKVLGEYCHAEGQNTIIGPTLYDCTINGITITIEDQDVSGDFWDDAPLILHDLTGGTGSIAVFGNIDNITFSDPDTIITLTESVTEHTSGKVCMSNYVSAAHAEGQGTIVSDYGAHAEGLSTTASGYGAHAEGFSTTASGGYAHAEGENTVASGDNSHAEGKSSLATLLGQHAFASYSFSEAGDAQGSRLTASVVTGNDTPANLKVGNFFDIAIRNNKTVGFTVDLVARSTSGGAIGAHFIRSGLIANNSNTTALIGSVGTVGTDVNASALAVAITADNTNDALQIQVTGLADSIIRWVARIDFVEVG